MENPSVSEQKVPHPEERVSEPTTEPVDGEGFDRMESVRGYPVTDEPPIIISGGSLYIDMPGDKELKDGTPDFGHPRPFRKVMKSGETIRAIGRLRVMTLKALGNERITWKDWPPGILLENLNCQLHLWLEQLKPNPANDFDFEPVNPNPDIAQIVLKGNPLVLELDKDIAGPYKNHKRRLPYRYAHPGHSGRPFRIYKWTLFNTSGGALTPIVSESGDDNYVLVVSFHHSD